MSRAWSITTVSSTDDDDDDAASSSDARTPEATIKSCAEISHQLEFRHVDRTCMPDRTKAGSKDKKAVYMPTQAARMWGEEDVRPMVQ